MTPPPSSSSARRGQSGGALFFILCGIVLFAALAYVITRTSRTSGTLTRETTALTVNSIMHYTDQMHGAVQRMVTNGVDIGTLSFQTAALASPVYTNASSTTTTRVFDAAGGGMTYYAPETAWLDTTQSGQAFYGQWFFPRNVCVPFVGSGGDGVSGGSTTLCNADGVTTSEDLVMVLPYIKSTLCSAIDQKIGLTMAAASATILPLAGNEYRGTSGNFADGYAYYVGGTGFNGKFEGCIQGSAPTSAGMYFYYKVLLER